MNSWELEGKEKRKRRGRNIEIEHEKEEKGRKTGSKTERRKED